MFIGIEHVAIASPDPERLAAWYRDTLDFRIVRASGRKMFLRGANEALLEILPSSGERTSNLRTDPGIRHLAIGVDDFEAACARLEARGIRFQGQPSPGSGNRMIFFEDLDGNLLHLIHRVDPMP
jgi:catechol 2,3-dioxygenase-like lactoylglutathione lyase family enzyme